MEKVKSGIIIALLLLAGSLAIYAHTLRAANRKLSAKHPPMPAGPVATSAIAVPIIDTYVDAAGVQHAVVDASTTAQIRRETERVAAPIAAKIDSISKAVGIKPSQLDGYTAAQFAVVRDSIAFLSRTLDAERRQTRTYKDKYLSLLVRDPVAGDTTDAGNFDFAYNADLKVVDYSTRRTFLGIPIGRRKYFTDISSSDPRLKIRGVDKLTVARNTPALGFRLQALGTYNVETRSYSAGLGVRFDIGDRFNTGVNYTYSFLRNLWVPAVYAKYDLLQFGR